MGKEERKSERKLVINSIKFFLIPSIIMKTYDGVIMDMSDSGLCLLTTCRLKDRQRIIIQDKSCTTDKVAIVRWSEKHDDVFYKIGLEFAADEAFLNIQDKRRYKRLNIKNLNISGKIAQADYIEIIDMSLGGLSIETDKKLNMDREYVLRLEYEGKGWSIKGYVAWSILKEYKDGNKGTTHPVYRAGMKLTNAPNEMREILKFIGWTRKTGKEQKYFSLRLDELDTGRNSKNVESCLQPSFK